MPIVISVVDTWVLAKKKIDDNFDLISLQLHTNCMIVKASSAVSGQRRVSQVHSRELETSPTLATTRTNPASSLRPARTLDSRAFSSSITEDIPKPNKQSTSDSSPMAHERPGARDSSPVRDLTRDSLRLDTADRSEVTRHAYKKFKHRRMHLQRTVRYMHRSAPHSWSPAGPPPVARRSRPAGVRSCGLLASSRRAVLLSTDSR